MSHYDYTVANEERGDRLPRLPGRFPERGPDPVSPEDVAARRAERKAILQGELGPILAELSQVGPAVESLYQIGSMPGGERPQPTIEQVAVVVDHLEQGGYSWPVVEGMSDVVGCNAGLGFWDRLKALYLSPDATDVMRDRLAASMGEIALKKHLEDLFEFVSRPELGSTRIYFLSKVYRWGGDRGKELVASLRDDPDLGVEATDIVHRSHLRVERRRRARGE